MINGVLVERTVKDIIPALKTNSEGLRSALETLVKQYKSKQEEMEKWKVGWYPFAFCLLYLSIVRLQKKNNIQVVQQ